MRTTHPAHSVPPAQRQQRGPLARLGRWTPALALLSCLALTPSAAAPGAPSLASERATPEFDHTHAAWTRILRQHTQGDRFDYAALKKDSKAFDGYLAQLSAVTPAALASWSQGQRFAFWINTYNAFTVKKIVEEYPLKSIRKLDGLFGLSSVFDREWIPMQAHHPDGDRDDLSPNDIEHGILRKNFPDARLHAAVNCASVSCPPLRNEAFVADRLEEQLEEQMRNFIRDTSRNRFDPAKQRAQLSEIFKWFAEDFERDAGSVREFVARFLPEEQRDAMRAAQVSYLDYDWDLNGTK